MICAAYVSSFYVKEDLAYNHFFVLNEDSTPKTTEKLKKNEHGLYGNDDKYGKNTNFKKLNVIKMKMVKSNKEETDSANFTADASDTLATEENSEEKLTSYNWNSDMQLYYYYIGQHVEEISEQELVDSSSTDTVEKIGFFARIFGKKKKEEEDTTTVVDPYAEFDFSNFENKEEDLDLDKKGKRKKNKKDKKEKKKKDKKDKNIEPMKKEEEEDSFDFQLDE